MAAKKDGYHHGDLRRALLDVAEERLAEDGSVSLRDLARRCGVSQTAPYRHFATKEALLGALATEGFRELAAELHRATGSLDDPRERLRAMGRAYIDFATRHPQKLRLMFGRDALSKRASPELYEAASETHGLLQRVVAEVVPEPARARAGTLGAWALVHGMALLEREMAGGPEPALVDAVMDIYGRGLVSPEDA